MSFNRFFGTSKRAEQHLQALLAEKTFKTLLIEALNQYLEAALDGSALSLEYNRLHIATAETYLDEVSKSKASEESLLLDAYDQVCHGKSGTLSASKKVRQLVRDALCTYLKVTEADIKAGMTVIMSKRSNAVKNDNLIIQAKNQAIATKLPDALPFLYAQSPFRMQSKL